MGLSMPRYSALGRFVKVTLVPKVLFLSHTTSNLKCCRLSDPLTSERPTNRLGSELPGRTAIRQTVSSACEWMPFVFCDIYPW